MKLKSLPKDLFAEVLDYIADYERLEGLAQILEKEFTILDVRSALREAAICLRKEVREEVDDKSLTDLQKEAILSPAAKKILSVLSPGDERMLLRRFGLLDE